MPFASFLTDFADQAVLLPLAVVVGVALYCSGWRRGALAWALGIIAVLGVMAALKLAAAACGQILFDRELRSPSGHTAAAAAIYGALIALLVYRAPEHGHARWLPAIIVAVTVGTTRIVLGFHTGVEVVVGGIVGICAAFAIVKLAGQPPSRIRLSPTILLAIAVTLFIFHGFHMNAEAAIRDSALLHWWPLSVCTTS